MVQQQNSQRTIFMADDDEDDRMLFLDAILELNLSVVVESAVDGLQLLDMLSQAVQQLPEIIFLDINMPGKNGFECLEEIRSAKGDLQGVKVVMLSTSSNPENIELCYELGADLYAVKPSTFADLKKLLLKVFQLDWYAVKKGNKRILMA
ncbi:response regulator [Flavobacterium saccharophilum]|uniref:Response regulator receiver domain-containing protein n=1 Tax=Flavobacterium saccharophilum TaxID=29534 RepID=A0A1M7FQ74_9FLAO|nr:response regulator [Flavobacterium saccharophilum]SHM06193.1 Response regulator receiver domain-containing protein [Flavobacterium saccharophilum]